MLLGGSRKGERMKKEGMLKGKVRGNKRKEREGKGEERREGIEK